MTRQAVSVSTSRQQFRTAGGPCSVRELVMSNADVTHFHSMATLIGLCIRVKLLRSLPPRWVRYPLVWRICLCPILLELHKLRPVAACPCECRFKVRVEVTPGTHASETAVNKQLNDKE